MNPRNTRTSSMESTRTRSMDKLAIFSFPCSGRRFTEKLLMEVGLSIHEVPGQGYKGTLSPFHADALFTHDFGLNEDYRNRRKVVIKRNPLACFTSWFEMTVAAGGQPDTKEAWLKVVTDEWIPYWKGFAERHHGSEVFHYEIITIAPDIYVQKLTGFAGSRTNIRAYPERNIMNFRHYDPEEFMAIEDALK